MKPMSMIFFGLMYAFGVVHFFAHIEDTPPWGKALLCAICGGLGVSLTYTDRAIHRAARGDKG